MRTTVRLDDMLFSDVKRHAAERGMTFTAVLQEALRELLHRYRQDAPRPAVELPTFEGRGLQQGVDLDDAASLLDLMEAADGAS